ncbi:MAG TPA: MFS transporter [Candidatus Limnocylindrales bacterium]|nr:MFS transporter [Candidatus Limnocylindrales bacterium]
MSTLAPAALAAARRRAHWTLVAGVALGSTGHIAAVTVATIVAKDMLGSATLAGAPGATVVGGAAVGSIVLSALMARRGRRLGLAAGYGIGVVGALVATVSVLAGSFPLLLAGTFLIGFGNTSNQLSRYTAADLVPAARRASAIGTVVWGATIGSVAGPWLVPISSDLAEGIGIAPLAGPYLVPVVFVAIAAILSYVLLRPDPYEIAHESAPRAREAAPLGGAVALRVTLLRPGVLASIVALIVGQFVMVLIMTMTPLHMTQHGHGLGAVGAVLSAHTLGMFALSPLSGRLAERIGAVRTIVVGTSILALSSAMAAAAPPTGGNLLLVALFLLGFGWNLGFVAGSALLSEHLELHERTRVQGIADALIWSTSAAASLGSGLLMAVAGYTALGILGVGLVVIPIVTLRAHGASLARAAKPIEPLAPGA